MKTGSDSRNAAWYYISYYEVLRYSATRTAVLLLTALTAAEDRAEAERCVCRFVVLLLFTRQLRYRSVMPLMMCLYHYYCMMLGRSTLLCRTSYGRGLFHDVTSCGWGWVGETPDGCIVHMFLLFTRSIYFALACLFLSHTAHLRYRNTTSTVTDRQG